MTKTAIQGIEITDPIVNISLHGTGLETIGFTRNGKLAHSKGGVTRSVTVKESVEIFTRLVCKLDSVSTEYDLDEDWLCPTRSQWFKMIAAAIPVTRRFNLQPHQKKFAEQRASDLGISLDGYIQRLIELDGRTNVLAKSR